MGTNSHLTAFETSSNGVGGKLSYMQKPYGSVCPLKLNIFSKVRWMMYVGKPKVPSVELKHCN